jgi:hypothetical protein
MHLFLMRNHAPVLSVSKELKTWVAVISLTLLEPISKLLAGVDPL